MRISDWSSDVCSSDLLAHVIGHVRRRHGIEAADPGVEAPGQTDCKPCPFRVTRIERQMHHDVAVTHRLASCVMARRRYPPGRSCLPLSASFFLASTV